MKVKLQKVFIGDASEIHQMQVLSFSSLLDKYQDYDLNPASEKLSKIQSRIRSASSTYYFIVMDEIRAGAVRVINLEEQKKCRVSPIFVLPEFQGRGVAQKVFKELERLHSPIKGWVLQAIAEEYGNCHLYEKLGYHKTDELIRIKSDMHIITYVKSD